MAKKHTHLSVKVAGKVPRTFRRAGRRFGLEPTLIPLADLSQEQLKALKGERQLEVDEVTPDERSTSKPSPEGEAKGD